LNGANQKENDGGSQRGHEVGSNRGGSNGRKGRDGDDGYDGDEDRGRRRSHRRNGRGGSSSGSRRDDYLKITFLNDNIPRLTPTQSVRKHYHFMQTCSDYFQDEQVKKEDLKAVILTKLPAGDRDWFRKWYMKGEYGTFIEDFRRKYLATISFAEFNRHMDRFNFDERLSAIKNGRSLSDHCKPLLAMLAKDVDRDRAELAMLEKFRGMLSASENVQISLEDPDRIIPNNLDDYLAMIERLEERTNPGSN
jgi:hypothetical protein